MREACFYLVREGEFYLLRLLLATERGAKLRGRNWKGVGVEEETRVGGGDLIR